MRKFKRLMSILMSAVFAFSFCLVWDKGQVEVNAATAADTVLTEFLNSGYNKSDDITIYDGSNEYNYMKINGRKYYQGIKFNASSYTSYITFNVEDYNSISFTPGAVDNEGYMHWATLEIYRDNKWYRDIEYSVGEISQEYSIDLTGVSTLQFKFKSEHYYFCHAICDISLDEYHPSMTYTTPQYNNSADFINSVFNKSGIKTYDASENYYIKSNGKNYNNGISFNGGSETAYYGNVPFATFNVENVDSLTFMVGHIDDTYLHDVTLEIYLDNKFYYSTYLSSNDKVKSYKFNTSNASTLQIKFTSEHFYYDFGLFNIVLNEDYDSITDGSYSDKSKIKDIDLLLRKGDIDGNGTINLYDIIAVAKYMMGMVTFNSEEMQLADYNEDTRVDLYDAVEMAKLIMK